MIHVEAPKMNYPDIKDRKDINHLVETFYGLVRKDEEIGEYFNKTITDWPGHFEKLTNFWETNLFFQPIYKGNPIRKHIELDQSFDNRIEQANFGKWIHLWFKTIDELFSGEKANLAKERARNMSHMMFIRIYQAR